VEPDGVLRETTALGSSDGLGGRMPTGSTRLHPAPLQCSTSLTTLNLAATRVTDAGLKELVGVRSLSTLDLSRLRVTAAGLKELAGLEDLATLTVSGVRLTDAQFQEVEKSLPKCKITR
jgi:hypothetical protein